MTPENARVIIVEDSSEKIEAIEEKLREAGHTVVGVALNTKEGERLIKKILEKGGADVALLDENIDRRHDGRILAKIVRDNFPKVKVISISADPQDWSDTPEVSYCPSGSAGIARAVTRI